MGERLKFPFDPLKRSAEMESVVMRGERRLYYRFRPAPYYGGIATADAVGCSFLCAYCWNYFRNLNPWQFKKFYPPHQVVSNLLHIAKRRSFQLFRISGAEPILGERSLEHLVKVLESIFYNIPQAVFILETNGFMLGSRTDLIKKLHFENLNIRICLKGTDEKSFELITGAEKVYFQTPLIALKKLKEEGIRAWPALMKDLFSLKEIRKLESILELYGIKEKLELESLESYPFVIKNMNRRNVKIKQNNRDF